MTDEMSQYSDIASSYKEFPLSALRHLQSILNVEIEQRLHEFGVQNVEKSVGNVGDVEGKETVLSGENMQEKSAKKAHLTLVRS